MRIALLALLLALLPVAGVSAAVPRIDGQSAETFAASLAEIEQGMGDAERLAFRMKLAQIRSALNEERGRHLGDAEFAAALDGKSLEELQGLAADAPQKIKIEIEISDDT